MRLGGFYWFSQDGEVYVEAVPDIDGVPLVRYGCLFLSVEKIRSEAVASINNQEEYEIWDSCFYQTNHTNE